jgi:hypothetical protein
MYGRDVRPEGDPFLVLLKKGQKIFSVVADPGVYLGTRRYASIVSTLAKLYLVDSFPICKS